ncbi:MAG: hypothetical protein JWM68_5704 [Verrucomicrobiales bacterium]|nr:hypothetical protein [Verrucomicrobiales bacterium]
MSYYPTDFGGPMNIDEGYRWNIPTVTYGFDPSFVQAFGQPGIDAVEAAIQVINDLPPASEMQVTNYAYDTTRMNYTARSRQLVDLKSYTLCLLMQQLGLSTPERYMWTFRELEFTNNQTNYLVVQRNFDAETWLPTNVCNGVEYDHHLFFYPLTKSAYSGNSIIDPFSIPTTVAGLNLGYGNFYTGLTADDVGGLRYQLHRDNCKVEDLPPGCRVGLEVGYVLRPGIEKLTFNRMLWDPTNSQFVPQTNIFTDRFILHPNLPPVPARTNEEYAERIVTRPDILFNSKDAPTALAFYDGKPFLWSQNHKATGPSFWKNNSTLNDKPDGDGPGNIQGPIEITYFDSSRLIAAGGANYSYYQPRAPGFAFLQWASFAGTTNIIVYGGSTNTDSMTVRTSVSASGAFEWILLANLRGVYRIDSSIDLNEWEPQLTFTNSDGLFTFTNNVHVGNEFYRAVKIGQE